MHSKSSINITKSQSVAISVIRVLAMSLIIACHFAQAYDYQIAFILNVGVQIFFFTSGFLYGKIEVGNPLNFYKKRFLRIYIPYILIVAVVLILQFLLNVWKFSIRDVLIYTLNIQGFIHSTVEGLNHLWFLSVLMLCYLLVPWVQRLLNNKPKLLVIGLIIASVLEFIFVQKMYSFCAWIVLFVSGIIYGRYENSKVSLLLLIGSVVLFVSMLPFFHLENLTSPDWVHYNVWFHCVSAILIFIALYYLLPMIITERMDMSKLKFIDKISYEVYLVHHPLILGPLALLTVTPFVSINIMITLLTTIILAYVCMRVCGRENKPKI